MPSHASELPPPVKKPRPRHERPTEDVEAYWSAAESDACILKNIEHAKECAATCVALTEAVLGRRADEEDDETAHRQSLNFQRLREGTVHPLEDPVVKPGTNLSVRQCLLESGGAHSLAFLKPVDGNQAFFLGPSGAFYRVATTIRGSRIDRKLIPGDPTSIIPKRHEDGGRNDPEAARRQAIAFLKRNVTDPGYARLLFSVYQVPAERLPVAQNPFHNGWTDQTHEARASVAASCLSAAMGLDVCPENVFRAHEDRPATLQRGVDGEETTRARIREAVQRGPDDPLALAYTQIAALQFADKEGDGGPHNLRGGFSIDNGRTFMPSIPTGAPEDAHLAERASSPSVFSFAWEVAERGGWTLPERDRARCRELVRDVATYYRSLSEKKGGNSPLNDAPHLRNGETAQLLHAIVRLAYERVDERGRTVPETRVMATKELAFLIARLDYLAEHGRPPVFDNKFFRRTF